MPETTISLDQKRAAYAWECVGNGVSSDYANLSKAAPALIMNNGLMQTLAFYEDKGKTHHSKLKEDILGWLHQQGMIDSHKYSDAMKQMHTRMSASDYRLASSEALELLKWIRTLAPTVKKSDNVQEITP